MIEQTKVDRTQIKKSTMELDREVTTAEHRNEYHSKCKVELQSQLQEVEQASFKSSMEVRERHHKLTEVNEKERLLALDLDAIRSESDANIDSSNEIQKRMEELLAIKEKATE